MIARFPGGAVEAPPASGSSRVGVVLCRVGGHRLAFPATDVTSIELPGSGESWAGRSFGLTGGAPAEARAVRQHTVGALVDSVEVHAEPVPLMPVPPALRAVMGGALLGFVEAAGLLWPVVVLAAFVAWLAEVAA